MASKIKNTIHKNLSKKMKSMPFLWYCLSYYTKTTKKGGILFSYDYTTISAQKTEHTSKR
jgi:hypothetical protein